MTQQMTPLGAVVRGLCAAAVGTAVMDAQQYIVYRLKGGDTGPLQWEFGGISNWKETSAPGKVGERLIQAWTGQPPSAEWAEATNTIMHWGFGIQWGFLYGLVAGSMRVPRLWLGPLFGTLVWSFSYTVLPLGHFYKPIWKYNVSVLTKDLATHLVYGVATAITFRLLARGRRG